MSMTEEPRRPVTKGDIIEKGLDAFDDEQFEGSSVQHQPVAGAVALVNIPDVINVAKLMSAGGDGVPEHCRANPGLCLRIAWQAVLGQFDPFAVAEQTYVVNHKFSYMSQYVHACINRRAPLHKRLEAEYVGNKDDGSRAIIITGTFRNGEVRIYESPMVRDIKPKNSTLWQTDVDQQLFYFGISRWGHKWVPEVLMGIYTAEDPRPAVDDSHLEDAAESGLRERLAHTEPTGEGHQDGHAARELAQLAPDNQVEAAPEPQQGPRARPKPRLVSDTRRRAKPLQRAGKGRSRVSPAVKAAADRAEKGPAKPVLPADVIKEQADRAEARAAPQPESEPDPEPGKEPHSPTKQALPRTIEQYIKWAEDWISLEESIITLGTRWREEIGLRNRLGMTSEDRAPLQETLRQRKRWLQTEMENYPAEPPPEGNTDA